MICNHSSHLDAVCLLATLPLTRVHHAFPVAAADYFFSTRLRSMLSTIAVNGLPIDRHNGSNGIEVCRRLLTDTKTVLIIFPEGTRTCSGSLGRFRSGAARLVAGTDIPVVPCYLSGAFEAWPKGRFLPRPGTLRLHIGRPRTFPAVVALDRDAVAGLSSQLRDEVIALRERDADYAAAPFGRRSDSGSRASISSSE
jgi:1-acyl-sn-glycerol-3-phosphate acyltransferase